MKKLSILSLFIAIALSLSAKDSVKVNKTFSDVFPGKPVITLFANYHSGVGSVADVSEFAIKRGYIGYEFDNGGAWSGRMVFDITSAKTINSKLEFRAYLKNAYVTWSKSKLELNFGIIKTNNSSLQERAWGHRYLMKSFGDEYGISHSADLGVSAIYKFTANIEADFSITNGKGFKNLEVGGNYRYTLGLTFNPIEYLTVRGSYDLYVRDIYGSSTANQHILSAFVGYEREKFSLGGEYNYMLNSDFAKNINRGGFAFYSTVKLIDKLDLFARYDRYSADNKIVEDLGSAIRTGVEYKPFAFLKVSPNVYVWKPKDSAAQIFIYLNLLINF